MNQVFVDTVGFLALWDTRDQWHQAAVKAFEAAHQRKLELVSSTFVFLELGNAAARKPYRDLVVKFHRLMHRDSTLLVPTNHEMNAAWEKYHLRFAAGAGIVDQVSFLLMNRLGITRALTNDDHFRAAGFEVLM